MNIHIWTWLILLSRLSNSWSSIRVLRDFCWNINLFDWLRSHAWAGSLNFYKVILLLRGTILIWQRHSTMRLSKLVLVLVENTHLVLIFLLDYLLVLTLHVEWILIQLLCLGILLNKHGWVDIVVWNINNSLLLTSTWIVHSQALLRVTSWLSSSLRWGHLEVVALS